MKVLSIALLGFGTVGRAVARVLASGRHPSLRLLLIFNREVARKRVTWVPPEVVWTDCIDEVFASPADVLVEVIGGREPARSWIARALDLGKAVVTANKQVIAEWGPELLRLAAARSTSLRFEAAVGAGIPVIHALETGLAGEQLAGIAGILNGTCNYVLTRLEAGDGAFETALGDAQRLGYAEANPAEDLDGLDARAKLAILAMVGLGCRVSPADLPTDSIRGIEPVDFRAARRLGYTIRQVAWITASEASGATVAAGVGPMLVPLDALLASVRGNQNLIELQGRLSGPIWLAGAGAGGDPTAVAILSDLLQIARGDKPVCRALRPCAVTEEKPTTHYVRLRGPLARETSRAVGFLSARGFALAPVRSDDPREDGILLIEPCSSRALRKALGALGATTAAPPPLILPVYPASRRPSTPCSVGQDA